MGIGGAEDTGVEWSDEDEQRWRDVCERICCDPLDPEACPTESEACYPVNRYGFICAPQAPKAGTMGSPCDRYVDCSGGHYCLAKEQGSGTCEQIASASGCCTTYCDVEAPDCPSDLHCIALADVALAPDPEWGFAHVGVCVG